MSHHPVRTGSYLPNSGRAKCASAASSVGSNPIGVQALRAVTAGSGQTVVTEGADTRVTDDQLAEGTTYYYSVFAQDEQGAWHLQVKTKLTSHGHQRWRRGEGVIGQAWLAADVLDVALRDNPRRM